MATVTPLWTHDPLDGVEATRSFLAGFGIDYERWELPAKVAELAALDALTDADKGTMLEAFAEELSRKSNDSGYVDADVIAIRPGLANIDQALAKFDKVHYHDDDEVRAIVGGRGVFGFLLDDGRQFLLTVEAGDYISVPAGQWHWFYCDSDRNITALRLFKDMTGWVPHYRPHVAAAVNG